LRRSRARRQSEEARKSQNEATSHFAEARRDRDEIKKEAGNERVAMHSDLAPIYAEVTN